MGYVASYASSGADASAGATGAGGAREPVGHMDADMVSSAAADRLAEVSAVRDGQMERTGAELVRGEDGDGNAGADRRRAETESARRQDGASAPGRAGVEPVRRDGGAAGGYRGAGGGGTHAPGASWRWRTGARGGGTRAKGW